MPGRYIETRVRLIRSVDCGSLFVTPALFDLTVAGACDTCYFVGCPGDTVVECTSGNGAVVNFTSPVLVGNCASVYSPITCYPLSGSIFPIGQTTVKCEATNITGGF